MSENEALARAKAAAGGASGLGRALGITKNAVLQWERVPSERVLSVERATGVSRHDLRPDLYPRETAEA
jgi:DNA-binding transcriptional regulator YdaS (Cro superfamily)